MMKNNRNETVMVIGIDHGYGNMKTATRCFPSGVARYDKEPIFQNNLLVYNGMYYQIGEEHNDAKTLLEDLQSRTYETEELYSKYAKTVCIITLRHRDAKWKCCKRRNIKMILK